MFDGISVRGAREHNLKDIDVDIPRNQITVITGLSGSGKSSLAFDTIFAEGQRRYMDSLSAYARQFLDRLQKPDVDAISGLSPAIAIEQKTTGLSPRSTVGTVTEIYDYLRLLYAKVGVPQCPEHHLPMVGRTPQQIVEDICSRYPTGSRLIILAPFAQSKKGEFAAEFQKWLKRGFVAAKIDGVYRDLDQVQKLAKTKAHDIDIVIDKVVMKADVNKDSNRDFRERLLSSIHTALSYGHERVIVERQDTQNKLIDRVNYSLRNTCPVCAMSFPEIEPRLFSFNHARGACPKCKGLGSLDLLEFEYHEEDDDSSSKSSKGDKAGRGDMEVGTTTDLELDTEWDELALSTCPECQGTRLRREARHVLIGGKPISDLTSQSATDLLQLLPQLLNKPAKNQEVELAERIRPQLENRLQFLINIGAGYLSLDRPTRTLSGGEAQRIRLATQLGSSLVGVLYVLDEPSIGLHPRDHHRLLKALTELRDLGNTILMVEHDEESIRSADHVIDMGPQAGLNGGEIIAEGSPQEISENPKSITGKYLSGKSTIAVPKKRRKGHGTFLELKGARGNNLKNVDLHLPLGCLNVVTGVSGSGKSTLIIDTLYRALAHHIYGTDWTLPPFDKIKGLENLDKVIQINQNPIGRTPRSTPATYVGVFPLIRDLFASLPDAKVRGYSPGRFSFNVKGGRCEACQGAGQIRLEMQFMPDVFVQCDTCLGRRFNRETLAIRYKDKNIADVLEMPIGQALEFFDKHPSIQRKLKTLHRVGLDYLCLGQSSTTLSGGEAQRTKLSKELSRRASGRSIYILDEPTTGLHFADVSLLLDLLQELVSQGNTVVVIEHHLDVIKVADHVIDLGPEAGGAGGEIVACGTPEEIVRQSRSVTGRFLKPLLFA